ncbi:hypothetical protein SEMRO_2684_G334560.1 [Seminavis robusta]|uniref:Uncharacterized protein n=1 Tax=Seminavis robusta TaxID=568900 RepID=A0A9N8HY02_9STRA|nr:hypothetical protein SEMRO_2684_G334560.1 [Seminavis robusta]|eukprot:Sro2684_g334560.1 n/a (412) ;mRNA; f:6345-7708
MDAAQITQLVTAAVAAALQDQAVLTAIRGPAQPGPPAAAFAVTPAGTGNAAWDFTSGTGLKIFIVATSPFTPQYDGKEATLRDFLRKVRNRAEAFGWTGILMVIDANGTPRNITLEYGRKANFTVNAAAAAQGGQPAPAPVFKEDGTCMLFDIIRVVSVETKATLALIVKKLANLEVLMEECKSDIGIFNDRVDDLVNQLRAHNIQVPSMINPLFDGYSNCAGKTFTTYISRKQEAYEDGTLEIEYPALMSTALEKYKVLKDRRMWLKKTDEELEILTLKAEMVKLKSGPSKGTARAPTDGKKSDKPSDYAEKNAWKLIPPKEGESHSKTMNGKKYIYCPYHHTTKWVLEGNNKGVVHKTGCEKMKEALAMAKATDKPSGATEPDPAAAALANAIEDVRTDTLLPVVTEEL